MSVEETVTRWRTEEEAVRARFAARTGYARPGQVDGCTGTDAVPHATTTCLIFDQRPSAHRDASRRADSASPSLESAHV